MISTDRFIGFNHRQIQDIIDFAESYNVGGAIVFVDFKKAFDSLEWTFIFDPDPEACFLILHRNLSGYFVVYNFS
jgi:hypothetical protein